MPDIKIKGYSGVELPFADVPKVWLAAPESTADNPILEPYTYGEALDGVEVEPDFSGGDIQVTVPEGYLLRSGVVKKPENLIPGNIKKGETIAGIPGEYEGETVELEEVTVDLAMANGDQVIEPSEGKALGKVTLTKPETLVPENIAKGVNIGGVIGALVAGGKEIKVATGIIDSDIYVNDLSNQCLTITHDLGVVPDMVIAYYNGFKASTVTFELGLGTNFSDKIGIRINIREHYDSNYIVRSLAYSNPITATNTSLPINNANENTVNFQGASGLYFRADTKWAVIGGLT